MEKIPKLEREYNNVISSNFRTLEVKHRNWNEMFCKKITKNHLKIEIRKTSIARFGLQHDRKFSNKPSESISSGSSFASSVKSQLSDVDFLIWIEGFGKSGAAKER